MSDNHGIWGQRLYVTRKEHEALKARYDRLLETVRDSRSKLSNAKYVLDLVIREAEGDEKKDEKECDSLSENLWIANDSAVALTRQRDALAALCEEALSRGCQCEGCVGELRQRLAELTKDSSPCT
jgi:hypothetical protein